MPNTNTADAKAELRSIEQGADQAAARVDEVRQLVREGDPKATPDAMLKATAAVEYAALRAEGAAERVEQARAADRLRELEALHDEIQGYEGNGAKLSALADRALKALDELHAATRERAEVVGGWRQRMRRLDVPEHGSPIPPPVEHGRLGHSNGKIIAGEHRISELHPDDVVAQVLVASLRQHRINERALTRYRDPGDVVARLAAIDASSEPIPDNLRFFETVAGAVIQYDREPTEAERIGLVREISRAEAWGE